jgi:spore germination cell wall hydrolase CwlJ-like protein
MAAKAGVLAVIRNRVADPRWPNTSAEVVTQPLQFSSFNANDPNVTKWPVKKNVVEWGAWQDCLTVVEAPLTADPTMGSTNYHSIPDGQPLPKWADPAKLTVTIGPFKFYRL